MDKRANSGNRLLNWCFVGQWGGVVQEGISTLYMLRSVSTASGLLAPCDKTQGDPERYLYLVVNRKMWAEQVQDRRKCKDIVEKGKILSEL